MANYPGNTTKELMTIANNELKNKKSIYRLKMSKRYDYTAIDLVDAKTGGERATLIVSTAGSLKTFLGGFIDVLFYLHDKRGN